MGVTSTGLTIPTLVELQENAVAEFRRDVDPDLDTSVEEPVGQINGVVMREARRVFETIQQVKGALDPASAEGTHLGNVGRLSGTQRRPARASTAGVTLDLDASKVIRAGALISHEDDETVVFRLDADVTATGAGTYTGTATCIETGPTVAVAGKLTVIRSPQSGWNSVTNALDAVTGQDQESDTAYRIRRELQLQQPGSATPGGVRSDVLDAGAVNVQVLENGSGKVDANGLLPWSIEVVVYDGTVAGTALTDDQIAQAIYDTRGAGTRTLGTSEGDATQPDGTTFAVKFSRPATVDIYMVGVGVGTFDADLVKASLVDYAHGDGGIQLPGVDLTTLLYKARCLTVSGVTDVTTLFVGRTASPTSEGNLVLAPREIAALDTSRIDFT